MEKRRHAPDEIDLVRDVNGLVVPCCRVSLVIHLFNAPFVEFAVS